MALFVEYRALFVEYRALFVECRALFVEYRALGMAHEAWVVLGVWSVCVGLELYVGEVRI